VYILIKEKRYGFLLDLRDKKGDWLSVRSIYLPAEEFTIALNVPKEFPKLRCDWVREPGPPGPPPEKISPIANLVPPGFVCYTQALRHVGLGTRLKGKFYQASVASKPDLATTFESSNQLDIVG
jgi:hypothetical protein